MTRVAVILTSDLTPEELSKIKKLPNYFELSRVMNKGLNSIYYAEFTDNEIIGSDLTHINKNEMRCHSYQEFMDTINQIKLEQLL